MPQYVRWKRCISVILRAIVVGLLASAVAVEAQVLPFRIYTHKDGLPSDQITAVLQDSRGFLWIGTSEGVSRFDGRLFTNFSVRDGLGIGQVNQIIESMKSPGTIYLALAGGGVTKYAGGAFTTRQLDSSFISNYVMSIVEDSLGDFWCTTSAGLYRFNDSRSTRIIEKLNARFFDAADSIVLYRTRRRNEISHPLVDDPAWHLENVAGMPRRGITCSYVDRERVLWIGTAWEGLWKLADHDLVSFPIRSSEPGHYNYSPAVADRGSHLWAISGDGLWEYWREGTRAWHAYLHPGTSRNSHGWLDGVAIDSSGMLWAVYTGGWLTAFRLSREERGPARLERTIEFSPLPEGATYTNRDPLAYAFDADGHLLYALPDGGIAVYNVRPVPRLLRNLGKQEGIDMGALFALTVDRDGAIWAGGYGDGVVSVASNGSSRRYLTGDGLPEMAIRSICVDGNGHVWVGTRRSGIAVLRGKKFESISVLDGLISNSVWSLAEDESGHMWAGTSVGLQAIDETTLKPLPPWPGRSGNWTGKSGVTPRGELWWHESGVAFRISDYPEPARNVVPPPVYITGVSVNGREETLSDNPTTSYEQNNWMIRFVGLSMKDPDGVKYRYTLGTTDGGWSSPINERSVTLGALAPGAYTFMVEAINADGVRSERPARYSFSINPPYWMTSWFLGTAFVIFGTLLYTLYRFRLRKIVELERLRTAIATDLHDDIGTSLTRIALYADASLREYPDVGVNADEGDRNDPREWLRDIGVISRGLVDAMNDIVWAVDPKNDSFESVLIRMKTLAARMFDAKGIDYDIHIGEDLSAVALPIRERRQFFLVFKEAVNNVIKHARATRVDLSIHRAGPMLWLEVRDNGAGFRESALRAGNGLRNMRDRAVSLGGECTIESTPGYGTKVSFKMTIPKMPAGLFA